jgi:peptidoglycan hydrolase-like protein with peptidoglycan-binding domain
LTNETSWTETGAPAAAAAETTAPAAAEQKVAETTIGPGSAGPAVRELAQLLEDLGHTTYVSEGGNHDDVMDDELLSKVRAELVAHVKSDVETPVDELEKRIRELAVVQTIDGEVWRILRQRAEAAKETPAA